ncbi:MAG: hypothetical protein K6G90_10045 [Clostridia bacterium]|nr:hypothetical protein [Clostridia bacterium]
MRNVRSAVIRLLSAILAVIVLAAGIVPAVFASEDDAPEVEKKEYRIAVVFDNSGSMYDGQPWCRAKYAMEIFASMLNYGDGDRLYVFPMWEVRTDGSTPAPKKGADNNYVETPSTGMIEISSNDDIDKISNLYTLYASSTPFQPVKDAADYLNKLGSEYEKWLIVLTDGKFDEDKENHIQYGQKKILQTELLSYASSDLKVQYLGIGQGAFELDGKPDKNFYAAKSSDVDLKDKLIGICNMIFQRNMLPADRLSGSSLHLDLSMRKLIVFAQGQDVSETSLTGADGKKVAPDLDSGQRKFSEISAGYKGKSGDATEVDRSLAGRVVTFGACPGGDYTLNCSGADKIQIFYEPNVRIKTVLTNSDGVEVDVKSDIYPGTYTLSNTIVDNVTKEDVSDSELLGNNITYDIKFNGQPIDNNADIELQASDDDQHIDITATYLKKYKIKNNDKFWPGTFKVILPPSSSLTVKIECKQKGNWYRTSLPDEWKPIIVHIEKDGQPLSDEDLQALDTQFDFKGVEYSKKLLPGESAYEIMPGVDKDGNSVKPEDGAYKLTVTAHTTDNFDRALDAKDSVTVNFRWWSQIVIWLLGFLILLVIAAIILFIMSRKVLPKHINSNNIVFTLNGREISGTKLDYSRKGKTLSIKSPPTPNVDDRCTAKFTLYPVGKRWTSSKRRKFGISKITAGGGVQDIQLNGTTYIRNDHGTFVPATDPEATQIKEEGYCPMIGINTRRSNVTCTLNQH